MKKVLIGGFASMLPVFAFAQNLNALDNLLGSIGTLVANATPIVFALALLFFFWGLARFILAAGDPDAQAKGKSIMIWGVVALFVMASVWGIIKVLKDNLGIGNETSGTVPSILVPAKK